MLGYSGGGGGVFLESSLDDKGHRPHPEVPLTGISGDTHHQVSESFCNQKGVAKTLHLPQRLFHSKSTLPLITSSFYK